MLIIIGCDFHPGYQHVAIFDNFHSDLEDSDLEDHDGHHSHPE